VLLELELLLGEGGVFAPEVADGPPGGDDRGLFGLDAAGDGQT